MEDQDVKPFTWNLCAATFPGENHLIIPDKTHSEGTAKRNKDIILVNHKLTNEIQVKKERDEKQNCCDEAKSNVVSDQKQIYSDVVQLPHNLSQSESFKSETEYDLNEKKVAHVNEKGLNWESQENDFLKCTKSKFLSINSHFSIKASRLCDFTSINSGDNVEYEKKRIELYLQSFQDISLNVCKQQSNEQLENELYSKNSSINTINRVVVKEEKQCQCQICPKSFKNFSSLAQHVKNHFAEKSHKCEMCFKGFAKISNLNRHLRTHTGEKPFECEVCHKHFTDSTGLKAHKVIHTGEKPFKCHLCPKTFSNYGGLHHHVRTHNGERPFSCDICFKKFISKTNLKNHKIAQHIEKPFKCQTCDKSFSGRGNLEIHIRTHTGERPYSCEICGKSFISGSHLNDHIKKHTGEKPFKCEMCQKCFSIKRYLVVHIRTHTGEKPFCCSVCNKAFSDKSSLIQHSKSKKCIQRALKSNAAGAVIGVKKELKNSI